MSQEPVVDSESGSPESQDSRESASAEGVLVPPAPERNVLALGAESASGEPSDEPAGEPGTDPAPATPEIEAAGDAQPGEDAAALPDAGQAASGDPEPTPAEASGAEANRGEEPPGAVESEGLAAEGAEPSPLEAAGDESGEPAGDEGLASPPPEAAETPAKPAVPPAPAFASELPKRSQRPGALALLKLERVEEDTSFQLRAEGEIDSLATSIARLGQLVPVDLRLRPPDRFQIVSGFRRVAALRLLKRERILARVHTDLNDEDALQVSLAGLLESRGAERAELVELRERLREQGRLSAGVADTLDRAISPTDDALAPEMVDGADEEVDLDELAQDLIGRMAAVNQDLALVVELWSALEPQLRETLLEQLGYPEQLVGYLRGLR